MVFNITFNSISVISWQSVLLEEETGVPRENNRPVTCQWQFLSHNVVSSTPRHEQGSNLQIWWRSRLRWHTYDYIHFWQLLHTIYKWMSYKKQELLTFHEHLGWPLVFGGGRVAYLFRLLCWLCCVFCVCFVCFCPMSWVSGVANFSGLSILDWLLGLTLTFIYTRLHRGVIVSMFHRVQ